MIIYKYSDPWGDYSYTRERILSEYYDYWKSRMTEIGKQHLIDEERCIDDWVVIHWAEKVEI